MQEYLKVNWAKDGPTQGTATLVGRLNQLGRNTIDAGQGAELPLEDGELKSLLQAGTQAEFVGLYNTSPGGDHDVRHKVAQHISRFYRIPAHTENTFLYQGQGRAGVRLAFEAAVQPHMEKPARPHLIMSDLHWDTLKRIAARQGLTYAGYDHNHTNPAAAIEDTIETLGEENVGAVLLNYPLNPTSQTITRTKMAEVFTVLDRYNARPGVSIHAILDMPYAFAAASDQDSNGRFIRSGVENVLQGVEKTKWSAILSGSKFIGAANTGLSMFVAGPNHDSSEFPAAFSISGQGLARNEQLLHNLANILHDREDLVWNRIDNVRGKYAANRAALETAFGPAVVEGSANMLSVLRLPASDLIGRQVKCCDGETRTMEGGYDVIEFLANNHGIGVVYNGTDKNGNFLLRLAQREKPEIFAEGVRRLQRGLDEIRLSPALHLNGHAHPAHNGHAHTAGRNGHSAGAHFGAAVNGHDGNGNGQPQHNGHRLEVTEPTPRV